MEGRGRERGGKEEKERIQGMFHDANKVGKGDRV